MGVPPPTPTWGNMLADSITALVPPWWLVFFPGLAITVTVLAFNLLGDGIRDTLDPRLSPGFLRLVTGVRGSARARRPPRPPLPPHRVSPAPRRPGGVSSPPPERLTLASYNIHRCYGRDGRCVPDRIADVLREIRADVVAIQEMETQADGGIGILEELARETGSTMIPGPTMFRSGAHYGNALLTRLPVKSVAQIDLSVPGREPRGAIDVRLDAGAGILRVCASHLGLRPSERRTQVKQLLMQPGRRAGRYRRADRRHQRVAPVGPAAALAPPVLHQAAGPRDLPGALAALRARPNLGAATPSTRARVRPPEPDRARGLRPPAGGGLAHRPLARGQVLHSDIRLPVQRGLQPGRS